MKPANLIMKHETGQCANAFFSFMAPIAYGGSIFSVVGH